jgi:hypothetical protein
MHLGWGSEDDPVQVLLGQQLGVAGERGFCAVFDGYLLGLFHRAVGDVLDFGVRDLGEGVEVLVAEGAQAYDGEIDGHATSFGVRIRCPTEVLEAGTWLKR